MTLTRRKARKGYRCDHYIRCAETIKPGDDYAVWRTVANSTSDDFHPVRQRICINCAAYMVQNSRCGPIQGLPACPECKSDERVWPSDVEQGPDWQCFGCDLKFNEEGR